VRKTLRASNLHQLKRLFLSTNEAVKPEPTRRSFGLLKASILVVPCVYIGGYLSQNLASFLEEWNIFVPNDDDDDD
jgi:hypothetical protein